MTVASAESARARPIASSGWIDLSHPIDNSTPPFPGDPAVEIAIMQQTTPPGRRSAPAGAEPIQINTSRLGICMHCGTHMDAPFHFIHDGRTIDRVPLEQCCGPAVLLRLASVAPFAEITVADLSPAAEAIRRTGKVILNTGWSQFWKQPPFFTDHPSITGGAADFLVECGLQLIGVDFPSVDRPPFPAHYPILSSGALIVENLTNLDGLGEGDIEFAAFPLGVTGRDGSPVRAVGRRLITGDR